MSFTSYQETSLWRRAFVEPRPDAGSEEQQFFQGQYQLLRAKASQLVTSVEADVPGLTVHDVSHLDALWDMASVLAGDRIALNPAEAFVFGASVLLHDAGMSLASYPNRINDLKATAIWKDLTARPDIAGNASQLSEREIASFVLRKLHAQKASELPTQPFYISPKERMYLIDETDLRRFYGRSIGLLAFSHWWPIDRVEAEFVTPLGAFSSYTRCAVNLLKLACLLRVADAIHLDRRRAPLFRRSLVRPEGHSLDHWTFQEKLASPHLEDESLIFTASEAFSRDQSSAWWLAYEAIVYADKELSDSNRLLKERVAQELSARRIKGAVSPEIFSQFVPVAGWKPVESKIHASSIPRIVESFGGRKLYGDDPLVAVRELIQNGRDAIDARRRRQGRPKNWGGVRIFNFERDGKHWLAVEDNGLGMSERVLVGPLIDFGVSFWSSPLLHEEFPGLAALGIDPVGKFGVGFFSVFMLGKRVRVITRPYEHGEDRSLVLEFDNGLSSRPVLYNAELGIAPVDGGTRVEVELQEPERLGFKRTASRRGPPDFGTMVAAMCPTIDVNVWVGKQLAIRALDWKSLDPERLCARYLPYMTGLYRGEMPAGLKRTMRPILNKDGSLIGRASISPSGEYSQVGIVSVGGMTANGLLNVAGVLQGEAATVSRNEALVTIDAEKLGEWATEQAGLIKKEKWSPSEQARVAEVVMECGGTPKNLVLGRLGKHWLNQKEIIRRLRVSKEMVVRFGEVSFEDEDGIPRSMFDTSFEPSADVLILPSHDGRIRPVSARERGEYNFKYAPFQNELWFRDAISKIWKEIEEETVEWIVGKVGGNSIVRESVRFVRM
jgi:hypothetical protein